MEANLYNKSGAKVGSIDLPAKIFGLSANSDLVHQVVVSMESNLRQGTANVKGRGEVRGGGRKPWKQKGTGRARHGSRRSPIWRGGGVTHGPTAEKNYSKKINKKMRAKALYSILSERAKAGKILFVDDLAILSGKTKDARLTLSALAKLEKFTLLSNMRRGKALLYFPKASAETLRSFRNIPYIEVVNAKDANALSLIKSRYLIISEPQKVFSALAKEKTLVTETA